jgi:ferredoxin-NADP reductase
VSPPKAQGYFEIIVKRDPDTLNENNLARLLSNMALGDELAFKGGDYRLRYGGSIADQIKGITVISSDSGIAPTLQILRGILSMDDIAVDDVELIWINEDKKNFVLENEVEKLELQHFEKFSTTKVLEKGLFGRDIGKNSQIEGSTSPFKNGRVAIVCAPDYHTAQITQFLVTQKKYPIQTVAVIDTQL